MARHHNPLLGEPILRLFSATREPDKHQGFHHQHLAVRAVSPGRPCSAHSLTALPVTPPAVSLQNMADAFDMAAITAAIPSEKKTYNDNPWLGKPMVPWGSSMTWIQNGFPASDKPIVLFTWGKFAKGDYRNIRDFHDLALQYEGKVDVCGISLDAEEEDARKLLKKSGTAMAEQNIEEFRCGTMMGHDGGKMWAANLVKAQGEVRLMSAIPCSLCFIISKPTAESVAKILWVEQFGASWALHQGQFIGQLDKILAGEDIFDNGVNPVQPEEETVEVDFEDEFASGGDY